MHFIWGLGIGDWGLGIGDWARSPISYAQCPVPNPPFLFNKKQKNFKFLNYNNYHEVYKIIRLYTINYKNKKT